MKIDEILEGGSAPTHTTGERAMVYAAKRLLHEVFPGQEIHAVYPMEGADGGAVATLLATLAALPPTLTLKLDVGSRKFDAYDGDEWVGGIRLCGPKAFQFYRADSVGFKVWTSRGGECDNFRTA